MLFIYQRFFVVPMRKLYIESKIKPLNANFKKSVFIVFYEIECIEIHCHNLFMEMELEKNLNQILIMIITSSFISRQLN